MNGSEYTSMCDCTKHSDMYYYLDMKSTVLYMYVVLVNRINTFNILNNTTNRMHDFYKLCSRHIVDATVLICRNTCTV